MNCEPKDLYQTFRQNIYGLILKQVRQKDIAEELTSETFRRICDCKAGGKDCNNPKAYLYRIAINLLNDYFKTIKKQVFISTEIIEPFLIDSKEQNLNKEVIECLIPLIEQLPDTYRQAVTLADIQQIPQIQIAEKLGISLSGTKSRIQRGRQQLKDLLLNSCQIETDRFGNVTSCIC